MKKFFFFIFLFLGLFFGLNSNAYYYYETDFNDFPLGFIGDYEEWDIASDTFAVATTTSYFTSISFETVGSPYFYHPVDISQTGILTVEFDFITLKGTYPSGVFSGFTSGVNNVAAMTFSYSSGHYYVYPCFPSSSIKTELDYDTEVWTDFKMVINFDAETFDVYMEDDLISEDCEFNADTDIDSIGFVVSASATSTAYFDNISILHYAYSGETENPTSTFPLDFSDIIPSFPVDCKTNVIEDNGTTTTFLAVGNMFNYDNTTWTDVDMVLEDCYTESANYGDLLDFKLNDEDVVGTSTLTSYGIGLPYATTVSATSSYYHVYYKVNGYDNNSNLYIPSLYFGCETTYITTSTVAIPVANIICQNQFVYDSSGNIVMGATTTDSSIFSIIYQWGNYFPFSYIQVFKNWSRTFINSASSTPCITLYSTSYCLLPAWLNDITPYTYTLSTYLIVMLFCSWLYFFLRRFFS